MKIVKKLWSYSLIRLCVYLCLNFFVMGGVAFLILQGDWKGRIDPLIETTLQICWLGLPVIWVWRRPFKKFAKKFVSILDSSAEGD